MARKIFYILIAANFLLTGCGGSNSNGDDNQGDLCKDGWRTPSKGIQGACSAHGGLA